MITNRDGLFYRGTDYGDGRDWTDQTDGAYHYTLDGAWKKICTFPLMFNIHLSCVDQPADPYRYET